MNQSHEHIEVALVFDHRAIDPAIFTMRSAAVAAHEPHQLNFHLVTDDPRVAGDARIEKLRRSLQCGIHLHELDKQHFAGLKPTGHIPIVSYGRLLLPAVLPGAKKVIYLDCDLFVNRDLAELWRVDPAGFAVAAVADFGLSAVGSDDCVGYARSELKDPNAAALNSGVLLIDLDRWRAEDLTPPMLDFCRRHAGHLNQNEQDAMNAILCGRWQRLGPCWNVQLHMFYGRGKAEGLAPELEIFRRDNRCEGACIFHFTGGAKPWTVGPMHPSLSRWLCAQDRVEPVPPLLRHLRRTTAYAKAFWRAVRSRLKRL